MQFFFALQLVEAAGIAPIVSGLELLGEGQAIKAKFPSSELLVAETTSITLTYRIASLKHNRD